MPRQYRRVRGFYGRRPLSRLECDSGFEGGDPTLKGVHCCEELGMELFVGLVSIADGLIRIKETDVVYSIFQVSNRFNGFPGYAIITALNVNFGGSV